MLSAESATGAYPARSVQTLDAIIRDAETCLPEYPVESADPARHDHAQALCDAAVTLASRGDAEAIIAVTRGGGTARRLSALRPRAPIIATSDNEQTARRLAIYRGVVPFCTQLGEGVDEVRELVGRELVARGVVAAGAAIVLVSINPDLTMTGANYLKIHRL
jgi:pyruvate kinase